MTRRALRGPPWGFLIFCVNPLRPGAPLCAQDSDVNSDNLCSSSTHARKTHGGGMVEDDDDDAAAPVAAVEGGAATAPEARLARNRSMYGGDALEAGAAEAPALRSSCRARSHGVTGIRRMNPARPRVSSRTSVLDPCGHNART